VADVLDFTIPKDPAMAEFAYAVLKYIEAQNKVNEANQKSLEALSSYVSELDGILGNVIRSQKCPLCQGSNPPNYK
jgi:hypothetical protein